MQMRASLAETNDSSVKIRAGASHVTVNQSQAQPISKMGNLDAQNPEAGKTQTGKLTQLQRQYQSALKKNIALQQRHHSNVNVTEPTLNLTQQ
jgi:hypothetical protein